VYVFILDPGGLISLSCVLISPDPGELGRLWVKFVMVYTQLYMNEIFKVGH